MNDGDPLFLIGWSADVLSISCFCKYVLCVCVVCLRTCPYYQLSHSIRDLECLPFTWENPKLRLENQIVLAIPFGYTL